MGQYVQKFSAHTVGFWHKGLEHLRIIVSSLWGWGRCPGTNPTQILGGGQLYLPQKVLEEFN